MNAFLESIADARRIFGEIELFVEFPAEFDGEKLFLSFTGEDGVSPLECNDPGVIEFLTGAVTGAPVIAPRGFPKDASDDSRKAIDVFAGELIGTPSFVVLTDIDFLFTHHGIQETSLNPIFQCAVAVLRVLTANYGPECRVVYWRREA